MFKQSARALAVVVMMFAAGTLVRSQDATPAKDVAAKQDAAPKQEKAQDEAKQEPPSTSVAPASVEVSPKTLDSHVGEKVKFSATAKDAAGNVLDEKPSVWFAAPFDVAGADESSEETLPDSGRATVGAGVAGQTGVANAKGGG